MHDEQRPRRPLRHQLTAIFLAMWFVLFAVIAPSPARAIPTETIIIEDIPARIREDVQHAMAESWGFQAQLALINALQFFGERFAYETAVWLASGGKAQSPLFNRDTALGFLADSALGAGLQFVDDMDKFAAGQLGFDGPFGVAQFICSPTIPSIKLSLKLGLADRLKPRQPLCTWSQLSGNWDAFTQGGFGATLSRSLSQTGIAFEPGQSDLSAGLELHIGLGEKQAQVAFTKLNESLANKGFRPLGEKISGLTKTPASVVEGTLTENVVKLPKDAKKTTAEQTSQALSAMDTFIPMLQAAGQALAVNFAVTLVSQTLQQQVLNKGFFLGDANAGLGGGDESAAPPAAREQQARTAFAELQRPRFVSSGDYDQLTEFASCDPQNRQLTACVIDEGFVQAVRRSQTGAPITVAEALAEGLLHRDWPFIRPATAKDQDPNCSKGPPTGGYCFSNLQKLRRARIIPIGWELAAAHEANGAGNPVTLGQVVDAFFRDGLDGICGTGDAEESPFCGLIDPNWVFTYPLQQCLLRGHGEQLIEKGTNIRAESCVDAPSCLERDGEGKCVGGYGYCVREKNIWHLAGQSCPGQYASCRAFTSRENQALAVLTSTIDRSVCTAENAGCRWYSSSRDAAGNWESGNRRYLNRLAEACTEANEGCTELISVKSAKVNLVSNPSFERNSDGARSPDNWALVDVVSTDGTRAADGSTAIQVTNTDFADRPVHKRVPLSGDQSYVLSASALRDPGSAATPQLRVVLDFKDTLTGGGGSPPVAGMRTTCTKGTAAAPEGGDNGNPSTIALYIDPGTATGYVRGSCTFVAPTTAKSAYVRIYSTDANPMWADAIQIEEGEAPTAFHDGYAADAPRTYLKVASSDLRCYDVGGDGQLNTANDHESCPSFAAGCTEADVGCERFTPQDGSPTVNGQFSDIDRCPAACVGYAAFREVESAFDQKDTFDFFIPSTARQCSAAEVGCSEFTNMDALERGGEQREYFSRLRRCEKPGEATSATYYTWEGSDQQGYQLRSFVLQRESGDAASAPPAVFGYGVGADPEPNCGPAPAGTGHYGKRVDQAGYDAIITPDCRAFYSQNGDIHYRRLSRTILITDDCVRYRVSHQVDSGTCNLAGGALSTTAGCVLKGHRLESQQCQPASAGCRAYRGNAGGAIQTIVATDFEAEVNGQFQQGWTLVGGGQPSTSLESLSVGGRSIRLTGGQTGEYPLRTQQAGFTSEQCTGQGGTFSAPDDCALPRLRAGGTYELIVVGKGTAQIEVGLQQVAGVTPDLIDLSVTVDRRRATLTPTWQRVVIGPLILAPALVPTVDASLWITVTGGSVFLDSVLFREVPQQTTVIKGSWQTPQACDRASIALDAAPLSQGMLGCRAYQMRSGGTETLRSFSRLCRAEVVGCTAFHDTRNSADLGSQTFNDPPGDAESLDDVTVPADAVRYLVDDRAKYCQAAAKGCSRFGKPTLDRTANVADARENPPATDWADAFLLDQPDRYTGPGAILCEHPALFCEEYRGQDGAVIYFKDPGDRTCEYREGVMQPGGIPASGWFRSGSDPPAACDPGLLIGGAQYGIWRNADTNYAGWSGLCQAGYDHCTEFVDPADRTLAHPNGQPYHAIRTTVDFASCQGGVSQKEGCVVLSDSSDPSTRFSAEASLADSDLRQGARVPVVNCDANPAGCKRCVVPKRCRADDGHIQGTRAGEPALPPGAPAVCLSDADCGDGVPAGFRCRGGEVGQQCATNASCATFGIPGQAVCREFENDGNAIIKVQRDRSCGQWLACRSATEARDPGLQRSIEVCESIDLCESYLPDAGSSRALNCARWVPTPETQGKILTRSLYQGRNRGWTGQEYSGYSIAGIYQAADLVPVNVSIKRGGIDMRLARVDPQCWGSTGTPGALLSVRDCAHTIRNVLTGQDETVVDPPGTCEGLTGVVDNVATASFDESRQTTRCGTDQRGTCVNHKCVYGIDGTQLTVSGVTPPSVAAAPATECRVHPEADAPFTPDVAQWSEVRLNADEVARTRTGSAAGYTGANVCEYGEGRCSCAYQKVRYGDGQTRYFDQANTIVPDGICDGGFTENGVSKAGVRSCTDDVVCDDERDMGLARERAAARCNAISDDDERSACTTQIPSVIESLRQHGKCKRLDRRERFLGLAGVCLERDQSIELEDNPDRHPCAAWYPVQQLAGGIDIYNQYERAGFHEEAQYCTDVTRYEYRKYIEGASITSCEIGGMALLCGGASFFGPGAVISCVVGAIGGTFGAAAVIAATNAVCGDGTYGDYTYHDYEVDWVTPWPFGDGCPPFFDIDFMCRPTGGAGWYEDEGGDIRSFDCADDSPTPCGSEQQAYRCTEVTNVTDLPTSEATNNVAWTDRARIVANPEEEFRVQRTSAANDRPEHPMRYSDSCSVFGRLPNFSPEDVGGSEGMKYWEVFPDDKQSLQECTTSVTSDTPTGSGTGGGQQVASAARHWETLMEASDPVGIGRTIGSLRGLFAGIQREWEWQRTNVVRQCTIPIGDPPTVPTCTGSGAVAACRENGTCGSVCRAVAGRCRVVRALPLGAGSVDIGVPVGVLCTSDADCGGASGSCMRSRASEAALLTGTCRGTSTACVRDVDCPAANRPCIFPPLITGPDANFEEPRIGCTSNAQCEVSRSGAQPMIDFPNGVCSAGCTNPASTGSWCSANADCTVQGECRELSDDETPETAGAFSNRGEQMQHRSALNGTRATGTGGGGPQIASIGECPGGGAGCAGPVGKFSVNGGDAGDREAPGGLATLEFWGWAHRNQMPIIDVRIQWGDGTEGGAIGKYQNHKPTCATGEDLTTSTFHCDGEPELTCDAERPCPAGKGPCRGAYCRPSCTTNDNCPAGSSNPTHCDTGRNLCVREGKRCLTSVGTATEGSCTSDADCAGVDNACIDVADDVYHRVLTCEPGECTVAGLTGQCAGVTSFGDFPDACTTTPFRYRHTYRCDGVNDPTWDAGLGGCVFQPRIRLIDNWRWCTKSGGAGTPQDLWCLEQDEAWIPFGGRVLVR